MSSVNSETDLEALFCQAVSHQQQGNIEQSLEIYSLLLEEIPDSPLVNYNKGLALYQLEQYHEACLSFHNALSHAPDNTDILFNLGLSLQKLHLFEEAVRVYESLLAINCDDIEALYNLGCCHKDFHQEDTAIKYYHEVLKRDAQHQSSLNNLAYLYHRKEDFVRAEDYFTRLLSVNPDHEPAKHMLACIKGERVDSAPAGYVEKVFNSYSEFFEENLKKTLCYSVPENLFKHYIKLFPNSLKRNRALDLGCGTGLSGEAFRKACHQLDGVDISAKMIEQANTKNIYTSLTVSEISDFLSECTNSYDLVIAADVFIYFGKLQTILSLLHGVANPGCVLCFSTERANETMYQLQKSGRFAHSIAYVTDACHKSGWKVIRFIENELRKEKGEWIRGVLYFAEKCHVKPNIT